MKTTAAILVSVLCAGALIITPNASADDEDVSDQAPSKAVLETEIDRISYAIGIQIGGSIRQGGIDIMSEALVAGIEDTLNNAAPALSEEELEAAMMALQQKMAAAQEQMQQEMSARQAEEGGANLEAANAFLRENAEKEGIVALDSGLQYRVLEEGSGDSPTASSSVRVHYKGALLDGTQFDSSYDRGEPASFRANQVIAGWTEALQLMAVGDKWELFIPPNLAYGESGRPSIPPNSLLIFEVELLEIED